MSSNSKGNLKRYNLVLPEALFDEIQRIADSRQTTMVDVLRQFIKLGIVADQVERSPNMALVVKEGNSEHRIILV